MSRFDTYNNEICYLFSPLVIFFWLKVVFVCIDKYPAVELTSNRLVFQGEQMAF